MECLLTMESKELEELYSIIDTIDASIFWKDLHGCYLGCNQYMLRMSGFKDRSQIIGKKDKDMPWHDIADQLEAIDQSVLKNGIFEGEESPYIAALKKRVFHTKKTILYGDNAQPIGIIGVSIDITKRKKTENLLKQNQKLLLEAKNKAEAANRAKTAFLENMRHDIRTPLTGIVGFADLIKMESDNPRIKEYAENLIASSHALLYLLDEVLESIRVSSGEIPQLKKKFNLRKALQHIIDLNRAKAAQKKLVLTLNFDPQLPDYVIGDRTRIHRVALELIANALNFTDQGFVTLSAHLAKKNQRELIIKLIVEDSGIGIPKDRQQEIYVPFTRLTPSYQGIYKGTGLGLSVVKQFINELDGEIYIESEPKKGSKFTCIIPLQEPLINDDLGVDEDIEATIERPFDTISIQDRSSSRVNAATRICNILVVEDNPIAQIVAQSILAKLNCNTDLAETGKKAVDLWKQRDYDLIFMDIGLPDFDGYEVTHRIRIQELTRKTHTPIIALTAHASDENKKRCITAGMNAVLTKPLTMKNCADMLDAFIPGHQKQQINTEKMPYLSELPKQQDHLFQLADYPLLDPEEGVKSAGNKLILTEMLAFMINDSLPKELALINEAHQANNWDKIQQIAHKIKGGAMYVGTIKMKMACQFLERYWKTGQRDLLEQLYQQAIRVINDSIREVSHWLNNSR